MSNNESTEKPPKVSSETDGDSISAHHAVGSLLKRTIRYHEERTRANGVLRCELWLSRRRRRRGRTIVGGSENENQNALAFCDSATSDIPHDAFPYDNRNNNGSSATLLGDRLANNLWSLHEGGCSDPKILWRQWSTLKETEYSQTRTGSSTFANQNNSMAFSARDTTEAIDWIASIPFGVPAVATAATTEGSDSDDDEISKIFFCGMVCWVFKRETKESNLSEEVPIPSQLPPNIESFLRFATEHIAATYAIESFNHFPLPQRRIANTESAIFHPVGTIAAAKNKNSGRRRMPPELCYNDDLDSLEDRKSRSSLEINGTKDDDKDGRNDASSLNGTNKLLAGLEAYFRKYRGAGLPGPLPLCWIQTVFTFVGCFLTIFLIHCFNEYISSEQEILESQIETTPSFTRKKLFEAPLEMGPFGASCVLIFAMTSAAPSQPRSMLLGVSIGMVVGKLVGCLESFGVGLGVRMSLATALTSSIMARTCTIFPPGAALALIFSSQLLGWSRCLLQVIGTVLVVGMGVVINNVHPLRTYPTFWVGHEGSCTSSHKGGNNGGGGCRATP